MPALTRETIRRRLDETDCDWCGFPLYVGDTAVYDLAAGAAYCCERCARLDAAAEADAPAALAVLARN